MRTWFRRTALMPVVALALAGQVSAQVLSWDFNADDGFWTQQTVSGSEAWGWNPGSWLVGNSTSIAHARLLSPLLTATENLGAIGIWHRYNFEPRTGGCFDGGTVSYSVNGGAWNPVGFLVGGYNGPVSGAFGNPLAGRDAWCGSSFLWGSNVFVPAGTLGGLNPGDVYQFAFEAGWDSSIERPSPNWEITQVDVYGFEAFQSVSTVPEPSTMALLATGLVGLAYGARKRRRS